MTKSKKHDQVVFNSKTQQYKANILVPQSMVLLIKNKSYAILI